MNVTIRSWRIAVSFAWLGLLFMSTVFLVNWTEGNYLVSAFIACALIVHQRSVILICVARPK